MTPESAPIKNEELIQHLHSKYPEGKVLKTTINSNASKLVESELPDHTRAERLYSSKGPIEFETLHLPSGSRLVRFYNAKGAAEAVEWIDAAGWSSLLRLSPQGHVEMRFDTDRHGLRTEIKYDERGTEVSRHSL